MSSLFRREPSRIDCFKLLADLERWGISNVEVAIWLNVPRSTLRDWKGGAEPRYTDGCLLIELHAMISNDQMAGNRHRVAL